jgi:hypothetical protein
MENLRTGLTSAEAQRIRAKVGANATPDVAIHPVPLVLSKFLAPVSILLEIAIVLQLALGASSNARCRKMSPAPARLHFSIFLASHPARAMRVAWRGRCGRWVGSGSNLGSWHRAAGAAPSAGAGRAHYAR